MPPSSIDWAGERRSNVGLVCHSRIFPTAFHTHHRRPAFGAFSWDAAVGLGSAGSFGGTDGPVVVRPRRRKICTVWLFRARLCSARERAEPQPGRRLPMNRSTSSPRPSPPFGIEERVRGGRERRRSERFRGSKREISFGRNLTLTLSRWEREQPSLGSTNSNAPSPNSAVELSGRGRCSSLSQRERAGVRENYSKSKRVPPFRQSSSAKIPPRPLLSASKHWLPGGLSVLG